MFKKITALILVFAMGLTLTGCKKKSDVETQSSEASSVVSEESKAVTYVNPLTGEKVKKSVALQRPVAIMVNNINVAQGVQTGLNMADIIYETEVEGGITRLLAVFQDFKSVSQIGTVRSARYDYIDLALGHNAIYAHHGQDNYHAGPHLSDIDRIVVSTTNGGARVSNGLSSEHTLYGYGDKLWDSIKASGITTTVKKAANPWQTFTAKNSLKFKKSAQTVSVPFSSSYNTVFKYDSETKKYTRFSGTVERTDYKTGESTTVKNVFILNSTITSYPGCADGKGHRKVDLSSGTGYYCTNGTYTAIKWSKGASDNAFEFTKADGTTLKISTGNSWVCIIDGNKSTPVFSAE